MSAKKQKHKYYWIAAKKHYLGCVDSWVDVIVVLGSDIDAVLSVVLAIFTFWLGHTIIMKTRGPNKHIRTARAFSWMASNVSADWYWTSLVEYVIRNAIPIRLSENVENATYLDSLKFWGNRIVKIASTLLAIIKSDKYNASITNDAVWGEIHWTASVGKSLVFYLLLTTMFFHTWVDNK